MAEVFPPTRAEPFFEMTPGIDVNLLKMTVRWEAYFSDLGENVNSTSDEINEQVNGLESEIGRIASIQNELKKIIEDAFALIESNSEIARIAEIDKRINDLEQLI